MAQDLPVFRVTVPNGTPKATPQATNLVMPARRVDAVEIRVPPGPRGEVGFQLGSAGTAVIPADGVTFIVTDDEKITWPLEGFWDSGSWTLFAYNTGAFPHTLEIRFLTTLPQSRARTPDALALVGQGLDQVPASSGPAPPSVPPPLLPPPPSLPPPPPLPPPPGPPVSALVARGLTPADDDSMRFAKAQRPDGTVDYFVVLADGSLDHYWTNATTGPLGRDDPPGTWLGLTEVFIWQGNLVVRGVGQDRGIWQTLWPIAAGGPWSNPASRVLA